MKISTLFFFVFLATSLVSKGQSSTFLSYAKQRFYDQSALPDPILDSIFFIIENKSNSDSLRVDAVHFLYEIKCDSCITFLLDHVNDRFIYGNGNSELDQVNYTACWTDLLKLSRDDKYRWKVFSAYLYSIQNKERDEVYSQFLIPILLNVTSKEAIIAVLKEEFKKNNLKYSYKNLIYEKNINSILNLIK